MKIDDFVDVDRALGREDLALLSSHFGRYLFEDAVFPLFLLDELLAQLLASRAAEFNVYEAWTEEAQIIAVLHYVLRDDALAAVALDRGSHIAHVYPPPG